MTDTTLTVTTILLPLILGCRDPLPCSDCSDVGADNAEPTPDLPCGGVDLMTDNYNCGICGNECQLNFEGTDWEAGTCVDGQCGPLWTICNDFSNSKSNCEEICASYDGSCVAQGCSGMTAALYYVGFFGECSIASGPGIAMTGPCDEPIPWESNIEWDIFAMCCCDVAP